MRRFRQWEYFHDGAQALKDMEQDGTAGDVVEWDIHRQELFRVWRINRGLTRHFMLRMRLSVSTAD